MSNYTVLVGRTAILAAVYDEGNLPTAILCEDVSPEHYPICLHSMRTADLATTDHLLDDLAARCNVDPTAEPEKIRARLYQFFEAYPTGSHTCMGCYYAHTRGLVDAYHDVEDVENFARKLCEDCA